MLATKHRRITKACFRTCSTCRSRSQAGFCLYAYILVSIQDKPTIARLRCFLGAYLPSKTAHQTMSLARIFMRVKVMLIHFKERYFTDDESPSYSKQLKRTCKCQVTVKLPGSFCPCIPRPRLHSHLNFAG